MLHKHDPLIPVILSYYAYEYEILLNCNDYFFELQHKEQIDYLSDSKTLSVTYSVSRKSKKVFKRTHITSFFLQK